MQNNVSEIQVWENLEVKRSASEASRRSEENLAISEATIKRYLAPPANTPYPLEYSYHLLGDATGKIVLDYGCGMGENSVLICSHGGSVKGIDISPELIELAEKRMRFHGFSGQSEFIVGSAHEIPLPDESVDVVFGMAILHHLDLSLSEKEIFRVLKKGGRAIFQEPVRNSKMMWRIRKMIPYQQPDVSPYERPLTNEELSSFGKRFSSCRERNFSLPYIGLAGITPFYEKIIHPLTRIDGRILKAFPALEYYATVKVIEMIK